MVLQVTIKNVILLCIICFATLFHYLNSTKERKPIIICQILVTYILAVEIQIPIFNFAQPLYYSYLLCKNQLKFWSLSVNLIFITFYCIVRMFYEINQQIIWTMTHYLSIVIIMATIKYVEIYKVEQQQKQSLNLIDIFQNSDRYKWKELSQIEMFQDQYTKYLCFNQIREGIILYEQGYDKTPTFINNSAKQIFQIQDNSQLQQIFCNYCKIDRIEVKRSLQSLKSIPDYRQNSIFLQQSGSLSQNSKVMSQIPRSQVKEVTFLQMLDKIWYHQNKETNLFYITKQNTQQQLQQILEISVYVNYQVKKIMTIVCRDLSYKSYIKQLENHNYQKSKMISFVSHEFRAPLGCMITMLEHVSKTLNNSYIQTSIDNSKYLLNLCNTLLDLAQLQAKKFQLKIERFNLKKLCLDSLKMYAIQAEKKQLKLLLNYPTTCPSIIESDPSRIKQIIINLIQNAFKFTEEGEITLSCDTFQDEKFEIAVSDTGIGVQEKDKEQLMKAFGKINSEESKKLNDQGVGLGLVISNKIAQQLGDGLNFESIYHKGSKFSFTIQLQNSSFCDQRLLNSLHKNQISKEDDSQVDISDSESSKDIKIVITQPKKSIIVTEQYCCNKILIVDDNQFNIEVLQMQLNKLNIKNTDYSINGYKAIEKIKSKQSCISCHCQNYQLIFMDLEMPGINGINASKIIFEYYEEKGIQLPIIVACSGYSSEDEFPYCQQVGMKFYLEKPVQLKQLAPIISHFKSL